MAPTRVCVVASLAAATVAVATTLVPSPTAVAAVPFSSHANAGSAVDGALLPAELVTLSVGENDAPRDGEVSLPTSTDRQTLVKILAALSAAHTWLSGPGVYSTTDGAGGAGGTLMRWNPDAPRPAAVVTLHGLGGAGPNAVDSLRADLPSSTLSYTSLYGPSSGEDRGDNPRSWFPIGAVNLGTVPSSDHEAGADADLAAAADRVDKVVAAIVSRGVPRDRVVLYGYSLGAATLSDYVLSGRAKGLAGVILIGGWMPRSRSAAGASPGGAAGMRVAILHGRLDGLVPPVA